MLYGAERFVTSVLRRPTDTPDDIAPCLSATSSYLPMHMYLMPG
jgi:hypothetical protein